MKKLKKLDVYKASQISESQKIVGGGTMVNGNVVVITTPNNG